MDIRHWGLGKIMQLPDWCFGERWSVCCYVGVGDGNTDWDIAEVALPERCVIWRVGLYWVVCSSVASSVRVAIGDQLPTSVPMMSLLEPLVAGWGAQGLDPRNIVGSSFQGEEVLTMRKGLQSKGQRIILEGTAAAGEGLIARLAVEVSSVPTEAPDYLVKQNGY